MQSRTLTQKSSCARDALSYLVLAALVLVLYARPANADDTAKANALVQTASNSVKNFLTDPQWQAVRNLLGGARAVFIVPHDVQAGFLITASGGDGVLLRRHGESWSDPIFLHISTVGVGFEAGGESQSLMMLIMTDGGVDQLVSGVANFGGSSGFALADLGLGASGGGTIAGGLQVLTVSTAQGLFAGGGLQGTKVSPQDAYDQSYYGAGYDMAAILARESGQQPASEALRTSLSNAVREAWGR